jgi:hypothetical protein
LVDDPGLGCVGFDSACSGHLRDKQLAGCSVELVPDRRSAPFDALALSVCAIPDDLGKTADSAPHEFGLRISVAPGPVLGRGWCVATECAPHLLQFPLAGERTQRVPCAIERKCHPQPTLEDEDEDLSAISVMLPRVDATNPMGCVDDKVADSQAQRILSVVAQRPYTVERVTFLASSPYSPS